MHVTLPSESEIQITREFNAPRERVFDAWTAPERLSQWMLGPPGWTMPVCESDLRPGGAWRYGWRNPEGMEVTIQGTYQELSPPEQVVTTSSWGPEWPETRETLTFREQDGRTMLVQRIAYPTREARDAALATGMTEGMAVSFARLTDLLGTPH